MPFLDPERKEAEDPVIERILNPKAIDQPAGGTSRISFSSVGSSSGGDKAAEEEKHGPGLTMTGRSTSKVERGAQNRMPQVRELDCVSGFRDPREPQHGGLPPSSMSGGEELVSVCDQMLAGCDRDWAEGRERTKQCMGVSGVDSAEGVSWVCGGSTKQSQHGWGGFIRKSQQKQGEIQAKQSQQKAGRAAPVSGSERVPLRRRDKLKVSEAGSGSRLREWLITGGCSSERVPQRKEPSVQVRGGDDNNLCVSRCLGSAMNEEPCVRDDRQCVVHESSMTRIVETETDERGRQIARVRWKCGPDVHSKTINSVSVQGRFGDVQEFKNLMCGKPVHRLDSQISRLGSKRSRK